MTIDDDSGGLKSAHPCFVREMVALVGSGSEAFKELERFLLDAGFSVRRFDKGDEALRTIKPDETDLILVDVSQSKAGGFELSRQFKRSTVHRNIPLVFIGSSSELEHKLRVFRCGGIDYITYPFQGEELVARLRGHIAVFSSRRELLNAQEELRLSKDSLKLAHAIARLGHWEWEMSSDIVRWSDEAFRIMGYASQECVPGHDALLQRVHPDERDVVLEHFAQMRTYGKFDLVFRIILPDGRSRMLHGRGRIACLMDCRYPHIFDPTQGCELPEHTTFIGVIQDVTEQKEIEHRLEIEAHTDALTGCASRRYFLELAQFEIRRSSQQNETLSLLMLDLDKFKRINDNYGHQVGDLTLQTLAEACRQQLRADDVIGRLGGEEFAVLLPDTPDDVALDVAERLRAAIEDAVVPFGSGVHFTASIGIATFKGNDADIDALLYRADRALYEAKLSGRNKVCIDSKQ